MSDKQDETEVKNAPDEEAAKQTDGQTGNKNFVCLYVAIGCFAVACILLALSFFIRGAGVYMLIASMLSSLACASFLNAQKRRGENKVCKILRIVNYVVMGAAILVVVVGMGVTSASKQQ